MEAENTTRKRGSGWKKFWIVTIGVVVVGLGLFVGIRYYYPFGEGVKTGQLNFVVYKGVIFKTYEGRLIQSGFRSEQGSLQSNEFTFSIADPAIADTLMRAGGQMVELHYKEYIGALPWRGYSNYIVDRIISIVPLTTSPIESIPPYTPEQQ